MVSGLAPLVKDGTGTLILTNSNSQVGGAVINQGTLQIGGGAGTGTLNGNVSIAANARLVFDRTNAASFGGISGTRRRVDVRRHHQRRGRGRPDRVPARSPRSVSIAIRAGPASKAGGCWSTDRSRDRREVAAGARLGGTGSIGGTVTIADGGSLAPGASVGTLTVGSLLLNPGSLLDYELGLPDIVGGTTNDLIVVTGGLTLDGTLYVADAGGFSRGVYRLINYGGSLTDNGLLFGGLPTRFVASDLLISTVTPGEVNLIVSTGGFGLQFWDGANTVGNGTVEGGTATWNNAATNWTAPDGSVNAPWQGGFAVFQGTAGTVTLGENIAFEGMQFLSTGYVIEGGGFGLAAAPDTVIRVDPSVTATINAPIADGTGGAARLTKSGAGLLILGGANSYSGGTLVNGGTLQIGADASLGAAAGALVLDAGTLATTASFASARNITLGENGGTFSTGTGTQLTLGGPITGRARSARPARARSSSPARTAMPAAPSSAPACWPCRATPISASSAPPRSTSTAARCASTRASTRPPAAP